MKTALLIASVMFLATGCDDSTPAAPAGAPAAAPAAESTPIAEKPMYQPEYTVAVKKNDAGHAIVTWTAKVNTGGYKLITDSVLVETPLDKLQARVWSTLEAPGPDDMVTQGFTTVSAEYDAGDKNVEEAELSIRQTVRGVTPELKPLYSVVKTWPEK